MGPGAVSLPLPFLVVFMFSVPVAASTYTIVGVCLLPVLWDAQQLFSNVVMTIRWRHYLDWVSLSTPDSDGLPASPGWADPLTPKIQSNFQADYLQWIEYQYIPLIELTPRSCWPIAWNSNAINLCILPFFFSTILSHFKMKKVIKYF